MRGETAVRCLGSRYWKAQKRSVLTPVGARTCKPPEYVRPERLEQDTYYCREFLNPKKKSHGGGGNYTIGRAHIANILRIIFTHQSPPPLFPYHTARAYDKLRTSWRCAVKPLLPVRSQANGAALFSFLEGVLQLF